MKKIVGLLRNVYIISVIYALFVNCLALFDINGLGFKDIIISWKMISLSLQQALEYTSWFGIPIALYQIADQHKEDIAFFIKQRSEYWKNLKKISETERDLIAFPIDIEIDKESDEIISEALDTIEHLRGYVNSLIDSMAESERDNYSVEIVISIPNSFAYMHKYLMQLRVHLLESQFQIDPKNKEIQEKLNQYRKELEDFIQNTSLAD